MVLDGSNELNHLSHWKQLIFKGFNNLNHLNNLISKTLNRLGENPGPGPGPRPANPEGCDGFVE